MPDIIRHGTLLLMAGALAACATDRPELLKTADGCSLWADMSSLSGYGPLTVETSGYRCQDGKLDGEGTLYVRSGTGELLYMIRGRHRAGHPEGQAYYWFAANGASGNGTVNYVDGKRDGGAAIRYANGTAMRLSCSGGTCGVSNPSASVAPEEVGLTNGMAPRFPQGHGGQTAAPAESAPGADSTVLLQVMGAVTQGVVQGMGGGGASNSAAAILQGMTPGMGASAFSGTANTERAATPLSGMGTARLVLLGASAGYSGGTCHALYVSPDGGVPLSPGEINHLFGACGHDGMAPRPMRLDSGATSCGPGWFAAANFGGGSTIGFTCEARSAQNAIERAVDRCRQNSGGGNDCTNVHVGYFAGERYVSEDLMAFGPNRVGIYLGTDRLTRSDSTNGTSLGGITTYWNCGTKFWSAQDKVKFVDCSELHDIQPDTTLR